MRKAAAKMAMGIVRRTFIANAPKQFADVRELCKRPARYYTALALGGPMIRLATTPDLCLVWRDKGMPNDWSFNWASMREESLESLCVERLLVVCRCYL